MKEKAWQLINEHRELFDSISKEFAVEIIAAALLTVRRETLEEAAKEVMDYYSHADGWRFTVNDFKKIAQAIRKLGEE